MTKYREILRLKSLGFSERNIALSCNVSRKTVSKVATRAQELIISWPLGENHTDAVLEETMFPKTRSDAAKKAHTRFQLHPQGASKKWCKQETSVDRIL